MGVELTARPPLTVNYLLEDTTLFGGVKIQLHHANMLHRGGHRVRVISRGARPDWYAIEADFLSVPDFSTQSVPAAPMLSKSSHIRPPPPNFTFSSLKLKLVVGEANWRTSRMLRRSTCQLRCATPWV